MVRVGTQATPTLQPLLSGSRPSSQNGGTRGIDRHANKLGMASPLCAVRLASCLEYVRITRGPAIVAGAIAICRSNAAGKVGWRGFETGQWRYRNSPFR